MALDPLEFGAIAVIIIVFFLWGPQKIPELARMIGRARKEFDNATREFQKAATSIQDGTNPLLAPLAPTSPPLPQATQQEGKSALPQSPAGPSSAKTGDQLLIEAARRLGIPTQGKTREQIQQDIVAMAQRPSPAGDSQPLSDNDPAA